jgi:Domain of unknown function (DUF1929)
VWSPSTARHEETFQPGQEKAIRRAGGDLQPEHQSARMIREVVLSRLPAQTHTTDVNQRSMTLSCTRKPGTNVLKVKAPPNGTTVESTVVVDEGVTT